MWWYRDLSSIRDLIGKGTRPETQEFYMGTRLREIIARGPDSKVGLWEAGRDLERLWMPTVV